MQSHIISLVQEKYDIKIPVSDIQACLCLPNKSDLLKIWNRKEGSAWENLVQKIRSPENSSYNSDEKGHIKLKIKKDSNDKARYIYISNIS